MKTNLQNGTTPRKPTSLCGGCGSRKAPKPRLWPGRQLATVLRIYLAARYSRRLELCAHRERLRAAGYNVQARWLDGKHQISDAGQPIGDSGEAMVEATGGNGDEGAALRSRFALDDYEDVLSADVVISFTEPPRKEPSRGGRHVEFGIALARGAECIVVGYRENLFHWLPQVRFFADWPQALAEVDVIARRLALVLDAEK